MKKPNLLDRKSFRKWDLPMQQVRYCRRFARQVWKALGSPRPFFKFAKGLK